MSNGLVRKVIAPLIIGIPLVFGGCHSNQSNKDFQEVRQISSEPLYKTGIVVEERITKEIDNIRVIRRSITGSRTESKSPVESTYGYSITVLTDNRRWVLYPSWPGPGGFPANQELFDKYNKDFNEKLEEMYNNIKPRDKIKFITGRVDVWSNGHKDEINYYEEGYNGAIDHPKDIQYSIYTNSRDLNKDIQKVK